MVNAFGSRLQVICIVGAEFYLKLVKYWKKKNQTKKQREIDFLPLFISLKLLF